MDHHWYVDKLGMRSTAILQLFVNKSPTS